MNSATAAMTTMMRMVHNMVRLRSLLTSSEGIRVWGWLRNQPVANATRLLRESHRNALLSMHERFVDQDRDDARRRMGSPAGALVRLSSVERTRGKTAPRRKPPCDGASDLEASSAAA